MSRAATSLIQATVDRLIPFARFDRMARERLPWIARRLTLRRCAQDGGRVRLFIIKQGAHRAAQAHRSYRTGSGVFCRASTL